MDEFEVAVLLSLNPVADPELYRRASEFVLQVESAADGWRFCLERLAQPGYRDETRFWCLEVILRAVNCQGKIGASDRVVLRGGVLAFLKALAGFQQLIARFVLTKASQLLAALVGIDYPMSWPQAFREGVLPLTSVEPNGVEVFFAILQDIDEELTSKRAAELDGKRAMRVKDAMREDCIVQVTTTFNAMLCSGNARYVALSLDAVRRYIEWVDINLVVTSRLVDLVHGTLSGAGEHKTLVSSTAAAMRAVLAKGMPPEHKLELMELVRVIDLLAVLGAREKSEIDVVADVEEDLSVAHPTLEIARLVNQVATECVNIVKTSTAKVLIEAALPAAIRLVGADDDAEVSAETFECINLYIKACKGNMNANLGGVTAILRAIVEKACVPENFDPSDEFSSFMTFRPKLVTIFRNIARAAPELGISTVQHTLQEETVKANPRPARAELAYKLLTECELILASSDNSMLTETMEAVLTRPLKCMLASEVGTSDPITEIHRSQACFSLFTFAYHAHRILSSRNDLLRLVLEPFFDKRGLVHPSSVHRSTTSGLLLKFFEKLRLVIAEKYLTEVVAAMLPVLDNSAALEMKDQLNLFEALGIVLGVSTSSAGNERAENLNVVLRPLILTLENCRNQRNALPGLTSVAAASHLAKGFTSPQGEKFQVGRILNQLWRECFDAVLEYYASFRKDPEVNARVIVFIQTAVDTIGENVLMYIESIVPPLLESASSATEMQRLVEFMNQIAAQFREEAYGPVNKTFKSIYQKTFEFQFEDSVSEYSRERQELRKTFFMLLGSLVTRNLDRVLVSPENLSVLEGIITAVLEGCYGHRFDLNNAPNVMKQCFSMLSKMVSLWIPPVPTNGLAKGATGTIELTGFRQFVLEKLPHACITTPLESAYFVRHGFETVMSEKIIQENISLQRVCVERCGQDFMDRLAVVVLPSLGCDSQVAVQYTQLLQQVSDLKQLSGHFLRLLRQLKRSRREG